MGDIDTSQAAQGVKKHTLLRTNGILLILFMIGFLTIYIINYYSNGTTLQKDIEHVATLTSEGIYYQIDSLFTEPVNVSLTMANDTLLKTFLTGELSHLDDASYLGQLQDFLNAYKEKYDYHSVFLVSTQTNRYYHFNGIDRVLTPENPENEWYYAFLDAAEEYSLNVDNDEANDDVMTVFVNCKIMGADGQVLGVVGVGQQVSHLQALLSSYDDRFDTHSLLIDGSGTIQLSLVATGYEHINLFDDPDYMDCREQIGLNTEGMHTFWNDREGGGANFVVSQYIPVLKWHLVVENNTAEIERQFRWQLGLGLLVSAVVILLMLWVVNRLILRYNEHIVRLTVSQELEYQQLLHKATEGLYENVFEMDITHNCAGGEGTRRFFESLGLSPDVPYEEALKAIAQKQIKDEFVQGYLEMFSVENVMRAYHNGLSELYYDMMITNNGTDYYWLRVRARIFYWASDKSVRMITYRQNIDHEKRREAQMQKMAESDPLTGLYNKTSTERLINEVLEQSAGKDCVHAFLMVDIDEFKQVNDTYGHAMGDVVIREVATVLKSRFRMSDIRGRIGGDEFAVFLRNIPGVDWLHKHARLLQEALEKDIRVEGQTCAVSVSIGMALYPVAGEDFQTLYRKADSALYLSKKNGKSQCNMYEA